MGHIVLYYLLQVTTYTSHNHVIQLIDMDFPRFSIIRQYQSSMKQEIVQ